MPVLQTRGMVVCSFSVTESFENKLKEIRKSYFQSIAIVKLYDLRISLTQRLKFVLNFWLYFVIRLLVYCGSIFLQYDI